MPGVPGRELIDDRGGSIVHFKDGSGRDQIKKLTAGSFELMELSESVFTGLRRDHRVASRAVI
jgi:hypothetical protein